MSGEYMKHNGFYDAVHACGVVPVVVLNSVDDALPLAHALEAGGLPAAEVTFRTDCAAACIKKIADACPSVLVGAGTVINVEQGKRAVDAGAKYLVSPGTDHELVEWALENQINIIPAGVTPTEITWLVNKGIEVTKFFPAGMFGGRKAIDALASVFVGHKFMPTGGVSAANLAEFLADPAIIAAGGTWMVKPALFADGDFSKVEQLAHEAAEIVSVHR